VQGVKEFELAPAGEPALRAVDTIDGVKRFQRIDGFGVNVTPAQWRGGALAPTLDLLVDDPGTSLVRLGDLWPA
jgi:hypothetical protein